jgi:hypothetical protein
MHMLLLPHFEQIWLSGFSNGLKAISEMCLTKLLHRAREVPHWIQAAWTILAPGVSIRIEPNLSQDPSPCSPFHLGAQHIWALLDDHRCHRKGLPTIGLSIEVRLTIDLFQESAEIDDRMIRLPICHPI